MKTLRPFKRLLIQTISIWAFVYSPSIIRGLACQVSEGEISLQVCLTGFLFVLYVLKERVGIYIMVNTRSTLRYCVKGTHLSHGVQHKACLRLYWRISTIALSFCCLNVHFCCTMLDRSTKACFPPIYFYYYLFLFFINKTRYCAWNDMSSTQVMFLCGLNLVIAN